jgi:hypothetical protein
MKILMQILTTQLTEWASRLNILPEEQAEFRLNRGCDEQIFNLFSAVQLGTRNKKKVYALFIDFKRAFPSVLHDKLWNKLYKTGVSAKLIRILQSLYRKVSTKIRLDQCVSDNIAITEGLMQGCVASPLLFTLFISDIMEVIKNSGINGIDISDLYVLHVLLFADDMVLLPNSPRGLQLKINLLRNYFEELGLTINVGKTQVVVFRRGGRLQTGLSFYYGEKEIEIVNEYLYLGVLFSSSCTFRKAAEAAKLKGMKALGSLWPLFYRGKISSWEVHRKLFDSMVSSTVLYGSHVWGWNYMDILERVQSQFIRRLFHLRFNTPTYGLRLETNSYKLELAIASRTINFAIRLQNMGSQRIANMCYRALPQVAHLDASRFNWSLNLKALLNNTGYGNLWTTFCSSEITLCKQSILRNLRSHLRQADIDKATSLINYQFLSTISESQLLSTHLSLGIHKARILAQLRLNQTHFYWKGNVHELMYESRCTYCNLEAPEDLYHFLIECGIHQAYQHRFLSPLQLNTSITRENLLQTVVNLSSIDLRKVILYIIVALNRRKWLNEM